MKFRHTTRALSRAGLAAAAVTAVLGGTFVATSGAASADPMGDIHNVVINEVESNGDAVHGDWIELYNNDALPVDLSGAILSDSEDDHALPIPSGTTIAGHGFFAMQVDDKSVAGNFGLGAPDSARLFEAGTTDLADSFPISEVDWDTHAPVTLGRFPDGTGDFQNTSVSTFDGPNQVASTVGDISGVVINEVESNGDATHGDWIELYNTNATGVDIGGAILSDSEDNHQFVVPSGTTIAGHGYEAYRVDDPTVTGSFGLGAPDSARLFAPGDTTLSHAVDSFSWTTHATVTYGRNRDDASDTGDWEPTSASTFDGPNEFAPGTAPSIAGVQISEVKTTGDDVHGDWIELHNTGSTTVDLSQAILSDDDDGHVFRIPTGTDLDPDAYHAFRVDDPTVGGNFGLGDDDSARLFTANTIDLSDPSASGGRLVDSESWTHHQPTSWGLNDSGDWVETNKPTFGAANDFSSTVTPDISWVVLDEIESDDPDHAPGDPDYHGEWIELHNTSDVSIDIGGAVLSDDDDAHEVDIPAGTSIGADGYYAIQLDGNGAAPSPFDLGSNDAIRFYAPGAVPGESIPLDHDEWTQNSPTTLGRSDGGLGDWVDTCTSTWDAANDFSCTP